MDEGRTEGILTCVQALFEAGVTLLGCNIVVKQLPKRGVACIVLATKGITPPHLTAHLMEAATLVQCPICAIAGLTSEALGKAVGLKKCMAVGVRLDADAKLLSPILEVSSRLSIPWVQVIPKYEELKVRLSFTLTHTHIFLG